MESCKWRLGRKIPKNIYVQRGPEPSDDDLDIGRFDSAEYAAQAVEAVNRQSDLLALGERYEALRKAAQYLETAAFAHAAAREENTEKALEDAVDGVCHALSVLSALNPQPPPEAGTNG